MASIEYVLRLNGLRATDLGWEVMADGGPWAVPQGSVSASRGPGLLGQVATARAVGAARTTTVSMRTISPLVEERRAALDGLIGHVDGLVEVEWGDDPGRYRLCRAESADVRTEIAEASWLDSSGHLRVELSLVEDDPVAFAAQPRVLAVGTDAVRPALGTATSAPRFVFAGPFTDVTITYRSGSGYVLAELALGGVSAGEYLEVDCGSDISPYVVVGDVSERDVDWSLFLSGGFFALDPGDRPSVEASEPGVMYYRQAWR